MRIQVKEARVSTGIRIDKSDMEAIEQIAKDNGINKADVMRHLMSLGIKRYKATEDSK